MERQNANKPLDRRAKYTRNAIKNTLLELMQKKAYKKITVTEICKSCEINRGTFYLHYYDLDDVLDDILSDIFSNATAMTDHVLCPRHERCTYPLCELAQTNPTYRPLFFDETASARIMDMVVKTYEESFITKLMHSSRLTFEQAEALLYFQTNGCLAINRMMLKNNCTDWRKIQGTIDRFLKAGLEEFLVD